MLLLTPLLISQMLMGLGAIIFGALVAAMMYALSKSAHLALVTGIVLGALVLFIVIS